MDHTAVILGEEFCTSYQHGFRNSQGCPPSHTPVAPDRNTRVALAGESAGLWMKGEVPTALLASHGSSELKGRQ